MPYAKPRRITYNSGRWKVKYPTAKVELYREGGSQGGLVRVNNDQYENFPIPDNLIKLYIEGIAYSQDKGDVEIELEYEAPGAAVTMKDKVKVTVIDLTAIELSFSGSAYHVVKNDNPSTPGLPFDAELTAPHWKDQNGDGDAVDFSGGGSNNYSTGDRRYPVAFTRDTHMEGKFSMKCLPTTIFNGPLEFKAEGPDSLEFTTTETPRSGKLTTQVIQASQKLPATVKFYDPMELEWKISLDGGSNWITGPVTRNRVCVTYAAPNTNAHYHTLLRNSCRDANGRSTEASIIDGIWTDFTDRVVHRADFLDQQEVLLKYYNPWSVESPGSLSMFTTELLKASNSQCGGWVCLFVDLMGAQGINHANELRVIVSEYSGVQLSRRGFVVKDWSYTGTGISLHPDYPYLNLPASPLEQGDSYVWIVSPKIPEVIDAPGVPGQGSLNPSSLFGNHVLVHIDSKYYDPSYGRIYYDLNGMNSGNLAGHYIVEQNWMVQESLIELDLNENGEIGDNFERVPEIYFFRSAGGSLVEAEVHEYP